MDSNLVVFNVELQDLCTWSSVLKILTSAFGDRSSILCVTGRETKGQIMLSEKYTTLQVYHIWFSSTASGTDAVQMRK